MTDAPPPARRMLHVCCSCADVRAPVDAFTRHLFLRETMRTTGEATSGAILGLDRDVRGIAAFLYDHRGPRAGPAIEVQSWIDPPLVGPPLIEPQHVGLRAAGIAVPALEATLDALTAAGATVAGRGMSPLFEVPAAAVVDPDGVVLDLVEDTSLSPTTSRIHHVRIACTNLTASTAWYEGLGFATISDERRVDDGATLGHPREGGPVEVRSRRLRLPDEPTELVLTQWHDPPAYARHPRSPNQAGWYRFALAVDDTRAAHVLMSEHGWSFDRPPMLITLDGTPVPDMWITLTSDPDGVPVELVQRPRAAFAPATG